MKRHLVLTCLTLLHVLMTSAQQTVGDSIQAEGDGVKLQQLIVPSALVAVGSFGVSNGWLCSIKKDVRDDFQNWRGDNRFKGDDYLRFLPAMANVGLGLAGVKSRHSLQDRLAATATASIVTWLTVGVTKHAVKEKRPDSNERISFPSGHTAIAFMGAELVREEYGNVCGAGAYAFATGIAFLRLYNDRHWLNDVIAGAGVGILSARIGYWLLPWERHLLSWDDPSTTLSILPSYQQETRSIGLALTAQF